VDGLLRGKVAIVTGGTRGLGRAIVGTFAAAGGCGLALDLEAGEVPDGFGFLRADVTREGEVAAAVAQAVGRFGRLDVVVANAGVVPPWRETAGLDFEEWDRVMAVNVRGVAATLKHAAPAMGEDGSIVVMASINGYRAHPRQMLYTASKHAVVGIVKAAALDLGRFGIRVNALAPGPIATEALLTRIRARHAAGGPAEAEALAALAREAALGRLATAEEVAGAALFLASGLSSGMTGQCLPVEAGLG